MTAFKRINGLMLSENHAGPKKFLVYFTSDKTGETLSIASESDDVMFTVSFEDVMAVIAKERKAGYKKGEHFIIDMDAKK